MAEGKRKGDVTYPDEVYQAALMQTMGARGAAARIIGCNRATLNNWIARNPGAVDYVEACKKRGENLALSNIYEGMSSGNLHDRVRASTWYLRFVIGYTAHDKVEVEATGFAEQLIEQLERKRANGHDRTDTLQ